MALRPKAGWGLLSAVLLLLVVNLLSIAIPTARPRLLVAVSIYRRKSLGGRGDARTLAVPAAVPAITQADLPSDFNWEAYRFFNPEVAASLATAAQAEQHYLYFGRQQGRLYKHIPVTISYTATWGLCNQLFSHLSLLAIASAFNATLVLSPAYSRADYKGSWNFRKEPIETLLDVDKMASYWEPRGVAIKTEANAKECAAIKLPESEVRRRLPKPAIRTIVQFLASSISMVAGQVLHIQPGAHACVHIEYGFPWLSMVPDFPRSVADMSRAARGLFFAPALVQKADAVVAAMEPNEWAPFLGVHLRIEGDWKKYGPSDPHMDHVGLYMTHMKVAGFNQKSPVYVASGIFSYARASEIKELKERLLSEKVCGAVLHKEALLPPSALKGLHSEQLALLDLLVLSRARLFVGDGRSSFAGFTQHYRVLHGFSNDTFINIRPRNKFFVFTRRLLRQFF